MRPRNKDTENLEARHRRRRECSSPDISSDPVTSSCISVKSSESEYCSANEDIRESLVGSERGGGGAGKHSDINKHEHTSKVPLPRDKQKVYPREGDYNVECQTHRGDTGDFCPVTSTHSTHLTGGTFIVGRSYFLYSCHDSRRYRVWVYFTQDACNTCVCVSL